MHLGGVAQLVEHQTFNLLVEGSIPSALTKNAKSESKLAGIDLFWGRFFIGLAQVVNLTPREFAETAGIV